MSAAETSPSNPSIATPCNRVCVVDPRLRLCIGCGRSLDEIGHWTALGDDERAGIIAQLPARLAAMNCAQTATRRSRHRLKG
jgi:predicted Fe-S protein YdhL (DUF1289 family)